MRLALAVWVVLVAAVCIRGILAPAAHSCYPYYEPAGRAWLEGQDLYAATGCTCRYSPLVNAFFAPLSLMPSWLGVLTWRLLNAAALLAAVLWWIDAYVSPTWPPALRALVLLMVIPLGIGNINCAQANPLLIGLMLAAAAAAARDRWNVAAVCCAAACVLKVYPVALALLFAVTYPRRFAPRFAAALAVGLALPFLLQHPEYVARQYINWWGNLCNDDRTAWHPAAGWRDLWLLIRITKAPVSRAVYLGIQLAVAGFIAIVCLIGRWRAAWPKQEVINAALGLSAGWMTVCGPATEGATYLLVMPTLAWSTIESWWRPWSWPLRGLLLASCAAFTIAMAGYWTGHTSEWTAYGQQPIGGLLLLAALLAKSFQRLRAARRDSRADAPATPARAA
jgi:hypothetical protein